MAPQQTQTRIPVVIVGAGLGGLSMAIRLKKDFPNYDFLMFEKASDIGGTWRDNVYPGSGSDVAAHLYCSSVDPKVDWPRTIGSQPEILDYWKGLAKKYDLYRHIRFHSLVNNAQWDNQEHVWRIRVVDTVTNQEQPYKAKAIVSAIGVLEIPHKPSFEGMSSFKGQVMHSARWNPNIELVNKRVGIIGNGSSSAQIIPLISQAKGIQVIQFPRTPNWYFPTPIVGYPPLLRWIFKHVPLASTLHRWTIYCVHEFLWFCFAKWPLQPLFKSSIHWYFKHMAPSQYHRQMTPNYPPGCKRIIFDPGYLTSLHQKNVHLNFDGVERFTQDGIVTKTGEHVPLDIVITATGFTTDVFPIPIVGTSGKTIQEYYDSVGGPQAYLGTTLPGFPNLFLISGPNTVTGHNSVIFSTEVQINYIAQLLQPLLNSQLDALAPTESATESYNGYIQRWLSHTRFVSCASWYRTGKEGKVFSPFPGPSTLFWWWLRRVRWEDYRVEEGSAKWKGGSQSHYGLGLFVGGALAVSLWACIIQPW